VRVDSHLFSGYQVPPYYDSLLAKIAVWGRDRNEAVERMERALRESIIDGVTNIIPLHRMILADEAFRRGEIHTGFVGDFLQSSHDLVAGAQKDAIG
jgi:acetyl/propionyl-CoA carboxylase alpha subunit